MGMVGRLCGGLDDSVVIADGLTWLDRRAALFLRNTSSSIKSDRVSGLPLPLQWFGKRFIRMDGERGGNCAKMSRIGAFW